MTKKSSTEETIDELIKEVRQLNEHVSHFYKEENEGIVINDTPAIYSFLGTLIATIVGGLFTIWIFKKQEKYRIKHEIRREFYKEYKIKYTELINSIAELNKDLGKVSSYSDCTAMKRPCILRLSGEEPNRNKSYISFAQNELEVIGVVKRFNEVKDNIESLDIFINSNLKVLQNYRGKLYNKQKYELIEVNNKIKNIEYYYDVFRKYNKSQPFKRDRLQTIDEYINEFNEKVKYIVEIEKNLKSTLDSIIEVHEGVENEFLGKYLKKNWINQRFKRK